MVAMGVAMGPEARSRVSIQYFFTHVEQPSTQYYSYIRYYKFLIQVYKAKNTDPSYL